MSTGGRRRPPSDDGLATVWAAAAVAALVGLLLVGLDLGAAVAARHRAETAADLAALAAAGHAVQGVEAACERARGVAAQVGGRVTSCRLAGWEALVEVTITVHLAVVGSASSSGRARAGPVASPALDEPAGGGLPTAGYATASAASATSDRQGR